MKRGRGMAGGEGISCYGPGGGRGWGVDRGKGKGWGGVRGKGKCWGEGGV